MTTKQLEINLYNWRTARRKLSESLLVIASNEIGNGQKKLLSISASLESETLGIEDANTLKNYLNARRSDLQPPLTESSPQSAYITAVERLIEERHLESPEEKFVEISPDQERIKNRRGYFVGEINGVPFEAKVDIINSAIPYRLSWIDPPEEASEIDLSNPYSGRAMVYAKALWDWFFANEMTIRIKESNMEEKWGFSPDGSTSGPLIIPLE